MKSKVIIETADCVIYPDLGQVEINNKTIRLGPINMKVLLELVNNQDRVVSRNELFDAVWYNQTISDDALTKCISEIRTKLGRQTEYQSLIVTIPKKGYQWSPSNLKKTAIEPKPIIQSNFSFKSILNNILTVIVSIAVLTTSFLWITNKLTHPEHLSILLLPIESYGEELEAYNMNFEDSLRNNILKTRNLRFLTKLTQIESSQYSLIYSNYYYKANWAIDGKIRQEQNRLRYTLNLIDTRTGLEIYSHSVENNKDQNSLDKFSLEFIKRVETLIIK